jgi:hypothetical protein
MKKAIYLTFLWLSLGLQTHAAGIEIKHKPANNEPQKFTLSGYLKDASNGEELIGASVYVKELANGANTNLYGFYSLSLPSGTYTVTFSYLGFTSQTKVIDLRKNLTLNIELQAENIQLEEVVVSSERINQVETTEMSVTRVNMVEIKKMPQLLGEVDVIRSIQLLPGVTTVGEGATGFNVRGGSIDQNLILLDEAPVYNASHLLGFFSVFNADAIKDVQIYRGGIPARFGGRLSSVLDVRQKEGNSKNFSANGGLGMISSRLLLEGPIIKDKASFMVAGRRSYMDVFNRFSADESLRNNILYFYDLNAKLNYNINENNRIFLSGYLGRDVFGFENQVGMDWGNKTATLRWNHLFNKRLFSNFTAFYSNYDYSLFSDFNDEKVTWTSNIINKSVKTDMTYFLNPNNTLDFGVSALHYNFLPGTITYTNPKEPEVKRIMDEKNALETAIFISNEQKINSRLSFQYGLRYSHFFNIGKGVVYEYDENQPKSPRSVTGSRTYNSGEIIKDYGGFEPRVSAKYSLTTESSVKASYNRMIQYIHLVSNTTASMPLDIWTPSGKHIQPSKVDQLALGYFRNFNAGMFEFSVETYYKDYHDLIDYKDGAQLLFNNHLEAEMLTGTGRAYGVEWMLRKQQGSLTGWVSYTLARTERLIEGINNNNYYPSNYDKPHDLSVVGNYQLNKTWNLGANFTYMTGRPITYPNARFEYAGIVIPNYDNRNGARVPDYHRLDISATYEFARKPKDPFDGSLSFGIYNVYARRNAFSVFFRQNEANPLETEAVRLSIFGIPIPSFTLNFKI